jgi:dephospho-CoA kinase
MKAITFDDILRANEPQLNKAVDEVGEAILHVVRSCVREMLVNNEPFREELRRFVQREVQRELEKQAQP